MREYLTTAECNLTDRHERANIAMWVYDELTTFSRCSECHNNAWFAPTPFCPQCGAIMLNLSDAEKHYELVTKLQEEKNDDF